MNAARTLLREGLDWLVILVVGCVSVPGFLMLLLRGMKWPLVLGGLTFAAYRLACAGGAGPVSCFPVGCWRRQCGA